MNALATFVGFVFMFLTLEVRAPCPPDRTTLGPCVNDMGTLTCPPGNYCNVDADLKNQCCSGARPTGEINCNDTLSECPLRVAQCTVNSYRVFMTQNCRKTCNRCTVTDCTDANPSLCPQWAANGFCESTFYTPATKQENCRATCGYC